MKNKVLQSIIDSSLFYWIVLPWSLYHFVRSSSLLQKEVKFIKESINENEDFYKSLVTIGFKQHKSLPGVLEATMPYQKDLSHEQIKDIAKKSIIGVVMQYVHTHDLLGVLFVETSLQKGFVHVQIKPANLHVWLNDVRDFILSLAIWLSGTALWFFLT